MIGEYFMDKCIIAGISLDNNSKNGQIFSTANYILDWYKKEISKDDIPIEFIDKLDIAHYIMRYRLSHKIFEFEKFIDGFENGKLKNYKEFILTSRKEFDETEVDELCDIVVSKKKICDMISGRKTFQKLLNDVETGNYIDDEEICTRWEQEISKNWLKLSEIKRVQAIDSVVSLDLKNDDYTAVEENIRARYNPKNIIKTGYKSVDNLFPAGGFEFGRLYIIGGTSNIGKSNFMINLITNAISQSLTDPDSVFLYITGENLISESLERSYCCFTGEPHVDMVDKLLNNPTFTLKHGINNVLNRVKSNIIMRYIKPNVTTAQHVANLIDEAKQFGNLKAVYLDYLDLTTSGMHVDDLRLDLGKACQCYKDMAVDNEIPFITATQLNRSGYDKEAEPTLASMSESMKKVDNADFVLFLQPFSTPMITFPFQGQAKTCKVIKMTVLKNRGGEVGSSTRVVMATRLGEQKIFNYRMEEMPNIQEEPVITKNQIERYHDELLNF